MTSGTLVVSGGWLVDPAGGGRALPARWSVDELATIGRDAGASTVLVHDETGWDGADGLVCELTGSLGGQWRWTLPGERPAAFLCGGGGTGAAGGTRPTNVVMLAADDTSAAGPWTGLEARELCDALRVLRVLLGVDWASSTGATAERLILSTHPRARGGVMLDETPRTPAVVESGNVELDYQSWRRPLTRDERAAEWVHVYDANAQHLAAWQAVELGHGEPTHHNRPEFDRSRVGFWRYDGGLDGVPTPAFPLLPAPWLPRREWYSTATVARMLEVSDGLSVSPPDEAWLWPRKSRFMRTAGERLRDARRDAMARRASAGELLHGDGAADDDELTAALARYVVSGAVLDAVKAVYSRQAGRFGMARGELSRWARPDWGHLVRATARTNLHRRMASLSAAPVAIATDALLFVTDEPDPLAFAARLRLPIGVGLGEFKHDGSVPAAVIRGELDDETVRAVKIFRAIGEAAA